MDAFINLTIVSFHQALSHNKCIKSYILIKYSVDKNYKSISNSVK